MESQVVMGPSAHAFDPAELGFIGRSHALMEALTLLQRFSRAKAPILICGETGTGKELAARAVHYLGKQKQGPFIPVNCASYPDSLFESAFFGHERGAFTDAKERRQGLVAQAEGGTLFLDEIDSLSLKAQAVLLRFIQERVYRPIGMNQELNCNINIVVATNADLEELSQLRQFRVDLYYRLNVAKINLPPLRARRDDILILAHHFINKFLSLYGDGPHLINTKGERELLSYHWPGNIRELENTLHRDFLRTAPDKEELELSSLQPNHNKSEWESLLDPSTCDFNTAKRALLDKFEKSYVASALRLAKGNISHAARMVGKERRAFGRLVKKYGIQRHHYE